MLNMIMSVFWHELECCQICCRWWKLIFLLKLFFFSIVYVVDVSYSAFDNKWPAVGYAADTKKFIIWSKIFLTSYWICWTWYWACFLHELGCCRYAVTNEKLIFLFKLLKYSFYYKIITFSVVGITFAIKCWAQRVDRCQDHAWQ